MKWIAAFLLLLSAAFAQELTKERLWTGTNGKSFRGIFIAKLPDGESVEIASSAGKVFKIALENLCEADRKLIAAGPGDTATPAKDESPVAFKPLPPIKRDLISAAPNEADGLIWPNSITEAVGGFLFLWDISEFIEIPRRGDAEKKCDWVIDQLKRELSPRNASLSDQNEVMKGIAEYFESELKNSATYRFHLVVEPTPERISEFTKAGDACFIEIFNDGWGIWFPVIDVQPNNIIRVAYRGKILFLKWTPGTKTDDYLTSSGGSFNIPIPGAETVIWNPYTDHYEATKRRPADLTLPTLEIMNKQDVPSHWGGDELIFQMRPSDPMVVCRPYAFADPEKIGPPPPEPGFGPPAIKK